MTSGWQFGVIREPAAGPTHRLRVVKIGGSLLARSTWPAELAALVAAQPRPPILVVGGGAVVDGLRTLDAACPRPPELMHTLAIDAMRLMARLVADAVGLPLVAAPPTSDAAAVLDVAAWLDAHPRFREELPIGWHVTSDSIAAVIAAALGGDLMLAKSVAPPCGDGDLAALAAAGWVDPHFPSAARAVNAISWAAPSPAGGGPPSDGRQDAEPSRGETLAPSRTPGPEGRVRTRGRRPAKRRSAGCRAVA